MKNGLSLKEKIFVFAVILFTTVTGLYFTVTTYYGHFVEEMFHHTTGSMIAVIVLCAAIFFGIAATVYNNGDSE